MRSAILLVCVLLALSVPLFAETGMEFEYYYQENLRETNPDGQTPRKDHLLSRGGAFKFQAVVAGAASYNNQAFEVNQAGNKYSANDTLGQASLLLPLGYFFLRGDQSGQKSNTYLNIPTSTALNPFYFFNDNSEFMESNQSAGLLWPSLGLEIGIFQGTMKETRRIEQSQSLFNLSYELQGQFKGVHFHQRPLNREGLYSELLLRQVGQSRIEGDSLAAPADYKMNLAQGTLGYGLKNGSRFFYSMQRQQRGLEFNLAADQSNFYSMEKSQGYRYGYRLQWDGRGISLEKRVKTELQEAIAAHYLSRRKVRVVELNFGIMYDSNLDFNLKLAETSYLLEKSATPLDPTLIESKLFADSTLGFGFALYFY